MNRLSKSRQIGKIIEGLFAFIAIVLNILILNLLFVFKPDMLIAQTTWAIRQIFGRR